MSALPERRKAWTGREPPTVIQKLWEANGNQRFWNMQTVYNRRVQFSPIARKLWQPIQNHGFVVGQTPHNAYRFLLQKVQQILYIYGTCIMFAQKRNSTE